MVGNAATKPRSSPCPINFTFRSIGNKQGNLSSKRCPRPKKEVDLKGKSKGRVYAEGDLTGIFCSGTGERESEKLGGPDLTLTRLFRRDSLSAWPNLIGVSVDRTKERRWRERGRPGFLDVPPTAELSVKPLGRLRLGGRGRGKENRTPRGDTDGRTLSHLLPDVGNWINGGDAMEKTGFAPRRGDITLTTKRLSWLR